MNEELDSQLFRHVRRRIAGRRVRAAGVPLACRVMNCSRRVGGRYAVIGATIRAEGGVRLNAPLAGRVSAAIASEAPLAAEPAPQPKKRTEFRWWQPVASAAAVAGVAAGAILWMRAQSADVSAVVAQTTPVVPALYDSGNDSGCGGPGPDLCRGASQHRRARQLRRSEDSESSSARGTQYGAGELRGCAQRVLLAGRPA